MGDQIRRDADVFDVLALLTDYRAQAYHGQESTLLAELQESLDPGSLVFRILAVTDSLLRCIAEALDTDPDELLAQGALGVAVIEEPRTP